MCKHFSFNPYAHTHTQCSFYDSDCYSLKGFRPFFRHLNKLNKPLHDQKKKKTLNDKSKWSRADGEESKPTIRLCHASACSDRCVFVFRSTRGKQVVSCIVTWLCVKKLLPLRYKKSLFTPVFWPAWFHCGPSLYYGERKKWQARKIL